MDRPADLEDRLIDFAVRIITVNECDELIAIFVSSVKTAEENQ